MTAKEIAEFDAEVTARWAADLSVDCGEDVARQARYIEDLAIAAEIAGLTLADLGISETDLVV
jgi:hypothetical protein